MDSKDEPESSWHPVELRSRRHREGSVGILPYRKVQQCPSRKEKGHDVKNEDFLHDILSKLPESRSSSMMNPYQMKKLFVKEKLTPAYTLDVLTIDLEKTCVENIEETKDKKGSTEVKERKASTHPENQRSKEEVYGNV